MSIRIVQGTLDQLPQIVKLNHSIFKGMYETEPYSLEHYQKTLAHKNPLIFMVMDNEKLVGDSVSYEENGSFYLWIMGIKEKYRNRGIGTKLLELNEEYAKANGFESVITKVFNVSVGMKRLLLSRGYQVIKVEKSEVNEKYDINYFSLKIKKNK